MVRASLLALSLVAACSKGQKAAPSPAPKDAAVVVADAAAAPDASANTAGNGEPARPPAAYVTREAALPPRKACKTACDEQHMSPAAGACYRRAQEHDDMAGTADITLIGERSKGPCIPTSVVIDCCPAFKPTDLEGIAKQLGWATATIEQRKAIAWVIARVVVGGRIVDEDMVSMPAQGITSMPATREKNGGVVLDYWLVPDGAHSALFIHEQLTFSANGKVTDKQLDRQELVSP
ncbi:MAG TPA: hypothetical protein VL326_00210 [Kofleriaceae bacterium]|jgi:hypothetical protein|nr:hypothetical protein [Kofleriaceae bacterium]